MSILFLIPARGGSKRLPGKNIKAIGGIPLVGRAVRLATQSAARLGSGCRTVCSTEDPAIAGVAREWGAEVPFLRPTELASDSALSIDVVFHALAALGASRFDVVVLLQPTSPLTAVADVLNAIRLHQATGCPIVSVCRAEHPAAWQYDMDSDGLLRPLIPKNVPGLSLEARTFYRVNGSIYVSSPDQLLENKSFICPNTRAYLMPQNRSVDIDTTLDFQIAETVLSSTPVSSVKVAHRTIGPSHPCFIIAEAGVNHNGNIDRALRMVDAAVEAGVDAVKFQTFKTERIVTRDAPKAEYQKRMTGHSESQFDMIKRLELSDSDHLRLVEHCRSRGIVFLSSPFDEGSADLLASLGVPAYKIPSGEITNLAFLSHVARKGRPMIVSTGMSSLVEVVNAVDTIRATGQADVVLLHCVSNYPAAPQDVNLRAMATMRAALEVPVGYSDHTEGNEIVFAAATLGAYVIEKHFTLDRSLPGPDHQASVEPDKLKALVDGVRRIEQAYGSGIKEPAPSEADTAHVARKSLFSSCFIPAGTIVSVDMVIALRPGSGLSPIHLEALIGRKACVDIEEGEALSLYMFV